MTLGPQFNRNYHGTNIDIPIGGEILPKSQVEDQDMSLNRPSADTSSTYFSNSNKRAWAHALPYRLTRVDLYKYGRGIYDDDFKDKYQQRPRVYVTEPVGEVETDPEFPDDSYKAKKQIVKDVEWIPALDTHDDWIQGTLPEVNWNKFNAPNWVTGTRTKGYYAVLDDRGYPVGEGDPVPPSYYSYHPDDSPYTTNEWDEHEEEKSNEQNTQLKLPGV